jgi:hypothetical protein
VLYLESIVRITASSSQTPPALGGGISTSQLPPAANPPDTTALQPVVLQFLGYPLRANFPWKNYSPMRSIPTIKVWLAVKLKYHRLKPGGVSGQYDRFVVVKLKYHRLKPVVFLINSRQRRA